jgi:exonuclease SbcC
MTKTSANRMTAEVEGDFGAFLNASPDDRSPLLEQITGTEVYSQISIRTHERNRTEKDNLKLLEANISGIILLDEEELLDTVAIKA